MTDQAKDDWIWPNLARDELVLSDLNRDFIPWRLKVSLDALEVPFDSSGSRLGPLKSM